MKNGNAYQAIKLKGETIMVRNACAFDALLHCTVHMRYKPRIQTHCADHQRLQFFAISDKDCKLRKDNKK